MLLFDIGCSRGDWIAANYSTIDNFVGVEANKDAYISARERFNDDENVDILHYLVSDIDYKLIPFYLAVTGNGEVSTASEWWTKHSRHIETGRWREPVNVQSITLDTLILRYGMPDHIKVDVEGYEYNALRGLTQKAGMISFEWAEEQDKEIYKCVDYLYHLGYRQFNWHGGDEYNYCPGKWMDYNGMIKAIEKELLPKRQQAWGMCYAV